MPSHRDQAEMSRLEDLRLQRELKEVILEYFEVLYAPSNPFNYGFGILVCRQQGGHGRHGEIIIIRAVVYLAPAKQKWRLLAQSSALCLGITAALQEFSKLLERDMGRMTASMKVGDVRGVAEEDALFMKVGDVCDGVKDRLLLD